METTPPRTEGVVRGRRAGSTRRRAHVPARTACEYRPRGRCRRCADGHRGAHRVLGGLADPHVRVRRTTGAARLAVGDVRLQHLARTVVARPQRAEPRRTARPLLQRPRHRHPPDLTTTGTLLPELALCCLPTPSEVRVQAAKST